jgi:NAD(P)-dependent dehydrogenase (short-subunit alcohol dehydrogenase family)
MMQVHLAGRVAFITGGTYLVSRIALKPMLARGEGRVITIASIGGLVPLRLQSAFVAAKAGVVNLTKSMALELGPRGVLTNAIAPGSTLTEGTRCRNCNRPA